jgi:alkanesulfonate monooxygenase SsuD/methylene tetrahydromethanopterin reductase-like flavin-dependent oxidoreductase (luciferase family)
MMVVIAGRDRSELRERAERIARIRDLTADAVLEGPHQGWIVGLVPDVAERLGALRDAGLSRVMCQHFDHEDVAFVELLGRELAPQLASG